MAQVPGLGPRGKSIAATNCSGEDTRIQTSVNFALVLFSLFSPGSWWQAEHQVGSTLL